VTRTVQAATAIRPVLIRLLNLLSRHVMPEHLRQAQRSDGGKAPAVRRIRAESIRAAVQPEVTPPEQGMPQKGGEIHPI